MSESETAAVRRQAQALLAQAKAVVASAEALIASIPPAAATENEPEPERRIPRTLGD